MSLAAGKLRHRVSLQRKIKAKNPNTGEVTYTWLDIGKLWASVEPLSAREFMAAQSNQSQVVARVMIRYRKDVTADMRVLHGQKVYNVQGVLADKDSGLEYITLPVSEGTNDG